ncbi:DUF6064 family protein [Aliifodinibius sp. S!AR15-10]|uniref:DUF6064 family protein n=1 Tax=Aliifodinibius sp. S!AR15-10 TaxID=2950437 RepID=UPI0038F6B9EE
MGDLPFTFDQFLRVFTDYNQAIWSFQLFVYLLGVVALLLIVKQRETTDKAVDHMDWCRNSHDWLPFGTSSSTHLWIGWNPLISPHTTTDSTNCASIKKYGL